MSSQSFTKKKVKILLLCKFFNKISKIYKDYQFFKRESFFGTHCRFCDKAVTYETTEVGPYQTVLLGL